MLELQNIVNFTIVHPRERLPVGEGGPIGVFGGRLNSISFDNPIAFSQKNGTFFFWPIRENYKPNGLQGFFYLDEIEPYNWISHRKVGQEVFFLAKQKAQEEYFFIKTDGLILRDCLTYLKHNDFGRVLDLEIEGKYAYIDVTSKQEVEIASEFEVAIEKRGLSVTDLDHILTETEAQSGCIFYVSKSIYDTPGIQISLDSCFKNMEDRGYCALEAFSESGHFPLEGLFRIRPCGETELFELSDKIYGESDTIPWEAYSAQLVCLDGTEAIKKGSKYWGYAAAGLLVYDPIQDEVLLIRRSEEVRKSGTWAYAGGARKKVGDKPTFGIVEGKLSVTGETPLLEPSLVTAVKETYEEFGYLPRGKLLKSPHIFRDEEESFTYHTWILVISPEERERIDRTLPYTLNWENDNHIWIKRDQAHTLPLHSGVQNVLKNYAFPSAK